MWQLVIKKVMPCASIATKYEMVHKKTKLGSNLYLSRKRIGEILYHVKGT